MGCPLSGPVHRACPKEMISVMVAPDALLPHHGGEVMPLLVVFVVIFNVNCN